MFSNPAANWYQNSRVASPEVCEHCGRVLRHERWCVTRDPFVHYAYSVVTDPEKLTLPDRLILHALGVAWENTPTMEEFRQSAAI